MTGRGPSGPEIGVGLDGGEPAGDLSGLAGAAEAGGAGTLWFANHLFQRDPSVQAARALAGTSGIKAALMAMSPYAMHPVQAVMAAATLDEHFPGRIVLSFGAGAPGDLAAAGIEATRPAATLAETLKLSRALLAGETVRHQGEVFRVSGRGLKSGAHDVPLVLAATGPRMLALAAAEADGVLLSGGTSTGFVEWSLGQVAAAETGRRIRRIGLVFAAVDEEPRRAYDRLRPILAFILRGPHHRRNLELGGARLDQQAVWDAIAAGDWDKAASMVPDEVVAAHSVSGTAAQVGARLAAYHAAGLDEIVLAGLGGGEQLAGLLAAARSLSSEGETP